MTQPNYYYRYGWVIVAVAFFIYTLSMITMANFGIFLVELVEQYQAPNAVIGWIGALQLACHGLVGEFAFSYYRPSSRKIILSHATYPGAPSYGGVRT